jgi:hypothetical protein
MNAPIDITCSMHGRKRSEHMCLFCCLCFEDLTPEECNVRDNGALEDVCKPCAEEEKQRIRVRVRV